KVADFGLAKMTNENSGFTQTNMAVGTPDFVAPEVFYPGVPLDGRADLYAVGVMLYQMLTGSVPRGAFKPASVIVSGVDARYDQIVLKAMQVDREERHSSAAELRQHLDTLLLPLHAPEPTATQHPLIADLPPPGMSEVQRESGRASVPLSRPSPQPVRSPGHSYAPQPQSKMPLFLGFVAVAAIAVGAFVMFTGKKPETAAAVDAAKGGASATVSPNAPEVSKPRASGSVIATKDAPFTNSLGMKFVPVAGTDVLFSIWVTRVKDYEAFASGDDKWKTQLLENVPVGRDPNHPVINVSWQEAQTFCRWLTGKELADGTLSKGARYRLPTDEEWSRGVGLPQELGSNPAEKDGKNRSDFPWGQSYPPPPNAGNFMDETFHAYFSQLPAASANLKNGWIKGYTDGFVTTSPVSSFPANASGLYDMGGNVGQWCEDWYDAAQQERVMRGSTWWNSGVDALLSSHRSHPTPSSHGLTSGFRCVLESPGSASAPPVSAASSVVPQATPVPSTTPPTPEPAKPAAPVSPAAAAPVPSAPAPVSALPPELAALHTQFIALQKERVTSPFEADLAKLNTGYLGGIAKKIAEEKAAGHLDGILALEAEQKLITSQQPVPDADEENTLASLKALRFIYRSAYAKLGATRATNLKALISPLEKRLTQMESDFAKADRVADAKTVRGYREVLKESSSDLQLASVTTPPQSAPKSTSTSSSTAVLVTKDGFTNSLGMKFVPVPGTAVLFC
ncbi:MAG: SUMF1/EgtB/PvdO family nonheme iron enzyme, partial [Prosthecobacter sp.]|nr:SUMF1/EgtB/PvdO family nonheme iron enzyme [Prosthecobacter sp.]